MGEDQAKMAEWFDGVGFSADRALLRREFPDVAFRDFESECSLLAVRAQNGSAGVNRKHQLGPLRRALTHRAARDPAPTT